MPSHRPRDRRRRAAAGNGSLLVPPVQHLAAKAQGHNHEHDGQQAIGGPGRDPPRQSAQAPSVFCRLQIGSSVGPSCREGHCAPILSKLSAHLVNCGTLVFSGRKDHCRLACIDWRNYRGLDLGLQLRDLRLGQPAHLRRRGRLLCF